MYFTSLQYWMYKLKDESVNVTDLTNKNKWQTYFTTASITVQTVSLIFTGMFMLFAGHKFPLRNKLYGSLTFFLICIITNIIFIKIPLEDCKYYDFCK